MAGGMVGADLESLEALAVKFDTQAEAVGTIMTDVDNGLAGTIWEGGKRDQFEAEWEEYKTNLVSLQGTFTEAAGSVRAFRDQVDANMNG